MLLLVAIGSVLSSRFGDELTLDRLAEREVAFREFEAESPWRVAAIAFLIYVIVTGLSLPGALVLSLTYAWLFGFGRSLLIVSFASTAGATIAFLLSRYLFRDAVRSRFQSRIDEFESRWAADGPYFLLTLRLVPAVPFFVVNLIMGLTPIRVKTYWWISQLGMLPGSVVYLYAGSSVPSLAEMADQGVGGLVSAKLLVALSLLGVVPLLLRTLIRRARGDSVDVGG